MNEITIELPSGTQYDVPVDKLGDWLATLMDVTLAAGMPTLTLKFSSPEKSQRKAKAEGAPASKTPKKQRAKRVIIDMDDLAKAMAKEGFAAIDYARKIGASPSGVRLAMIRINKGNK